MICGFYAIISDTLKNNIWIRAKYIEYNTSKGFRGIGENSYKFRCEDGIEIVLTSGKDLDLRLGNNYEVNYGIESKIIFDYREI